MIVFVTGISGTQRRAYVDAAAASIGGGTHRLSVGEIMLNVARDIGLPVREGMILNRAPRDLGALLYSALQQVDTEIREHSINDFVIIDLHATFRHNQLLLAGLNVPVLRSIADHCRAAGHEVVIANLVETAPSVWRQLQDDGAREAVEQGASSWKSSLSVLDVLIWRDEERFVSKVLAEVLGARFYLLPIGDPPTTLSRLLTNPAAKKVYLSYPISGIIRTKPELLDEVEHFAEQLREEFVVFNPLAIKDAQWVAGNMAGEGWPAATEIERAHVNQQTVQRDLLFIDQSDFTVVYNKLEQPVWSDGVVTEMNHTAMQGKPLFAIHVAAPGPFLLNLATQIFPSTEEALTHLREAFPPGA